MAKDENTPGSRDEELDASAAEALARLTSIDTKKSVLPIGSRLRNYFLTGLIIVGPVGITLYVIWWFVNLIDAWVKPWVPQIYLPETYLPFTVPGVGLIFSITVLIVVGALTANLFGRTVVSYGEIMLGRMPVVRSVYRALKQIFETVLSQSSNSFQQVGLVEYPRLGLYAIVFVSTATKGEIDKKVLKGEPMLSVFLPTTPNPTSGYLLFVPTKDVTILDMSVEEAAKLVISAGLVVPPYQDKLKKLAKDARSKPRRPARARQKTHQKTPA
ncbi:MAG: DUF502 domain-containing protein [Methyloligellaceae bacterium]